MTEQVSPLHQSLAALSDQLWRRVGITQAFDRLLVDAAAAHPGPVAGVRQAAGRSLTAGAARFYDMSFPQLLRDLVKRGVLVEKAGQVSLAAGFIEKIQGVLASQAAGQSHVEPTPGVTMEDLQSLADLRAEREKATKSTRTPSPKKPAGEKTTKAPKSGTTPRKRAGKEPDPNLPEAPAVAKAAQAASAPHRAPVSGLFTSLRINKLLDVLDTGSLNPEQLADRLDMPKRDLERFLSVSESLGITRRNGSLVELHWQGLELARTTTADRRVKVTDAVKSLRDKAAELDA